jgi:RNA polymerase sigma factor (sigma-70 family)
MCKPFLQFRGSKSVEVQQEAADVKLLQQFSMGDVQPFLCEFDPFLRRQLRVWGVSEHDADDVLQEVWMRVMGRTERRMTSVRVWMVSMARHVLREWQRRRGNMGFVAPKKLDRLPAGVGLRGERGILDLIHAAVSHLPADERRLYCRYFEEGATRTQLTGEIGGLYVSISTVEGHLRLLRQAIADALCAQPSKLSAQDLRACLLQLAKNGSTLRTWWQNSGFQREKSRG